MSIISGIGRAAMDANKKELKKETRMSQRDWYPKNPYSVISGFKYDIACEDWDVPTIIEGASYRGYELGCIDTLKAVAAMMYEEGLDFWLTSWRRGQPEATVRLDFKKVLGIDNETTGK